MWRQFTRSLLAAALLQQIAHGFQVSVSNMCSSDMVLATVTSGSVSTQALSAGGTTSVSVTSGSVVLKSGTGAQATRKWSAHGVSFVNLY